MGSQGMVMKMILALILGFSLLVAGCETGIAGAQAYPPEYYYGPGYSTVPPSWYDYDPTMQKWYTPPYFNPYYPNF